MLPRLTPRPKTGHELRSDGVRRSVLYGLQLPRVADDDDLAVAGLRTIYGWPISSRTSRATWPGSVSSARWWLSCCLTGQVLCDWLPGLAADQWAMNQQQPSSHALIRITDAVDGRGPSLGAVSPLMRGGKHRERGRVPGRRN